MPKRDAATPSVRVRMYRQGLGDCFLLRFSRGDTSPFNVLIDCGVLLGTPDARERMADVARDIALETGGRVDVLVATHEHWDHLSGFLQAREMFDRMKVGEVWLGWTEEEGNPLADELRGERRRMVAGLRALSGTMEGSDVVGLAEVRLGIDGLLGFFGEAPGPAVAGGRSTAEALAYLKGRPDATVWYRHPGDRLPLPGLEGVRAYVLGPPEDRKLIRKSNPGQQRPETYLHLKSAESLMAAVSGLDDGPGALESLRRAELSHPFDPRYRLTPGQAMRDPFLRDCYDLRDEHADDSWRRIDDGWLEAATDLALALDNNTNNTSLVLAFELGEGGPVLLFPGDAQVGNWLSWEDLSWHSEPQRPATGDEVKAAHLLRRTVLYKVGHHGSHNATLRDRGLELMESPELVAMLPVDSWMAAVRRWQMPYAPLYERLLQKAKGRVLRADTGVPSHQETRGYGTTEREWKKFEERVQQSDLWIEYRIEY